VPGADRERLAVAVAVVRQCLDAGLLAEVQINLIPVVLGDGVPFFDGMGREVSLEGPEVI
jgi:dihydrofolate reductase